MSIQTASSYGAYSEMLRAIGSTPKERLEYFRNKKEKDTDFAATMSKTETIEWLREQAADGVQMMHIVGSDDVYSVNIASKGDKALTEAEAARLREAYGAGGMTPGDAAHLLGELSMMGVVSGAAARAQIDALLGNSLGGRDGVSDMQVLIVAVMESVARDEIFLRNHGADPLGDIFIDNSVRRLIGEKTKLADVLRTILG